MNSNNSDLCAPGYDVLWIPNVHSLFQDVIYNNVRPGPDVAYLTDVRSRKITSIEFCLECDCHKFIEEKGQERTNKSINK